MEQRDTVQFLRGGAHDRAVAVLPVDPDGRRDDDFNDGGGAGFVFRYQGAKKNMVCRASFPAVCFILAVGCHAAGAGAV